MQRGAGLLLLIILAVFMAACASSNRNYSALYDPDSDWQIVFRDEFSGTGEPDPEKWISQEYNRRIDTKGPDGWWLKENVRLDGWGHLEIRVNEIENRNPEEDSDPYDYASGMVSTEGKFEPVFGRFEARMKLPDDPGWWVAFWLFADSVENEDGSGVDGIEIDIVEGFGWTDELNFALHWDGYHEAHQSVFERRNFPRIRRGWHIFALEWTETEYVWFVDNVEVWRSSAGGVSRAPQWIKFSGEVSEAPGVANKWWSNMPDRKRFPDKFLVDWVRVYQKKPASPEEAS